MSRCHGSPSTVGALLDDVRARAAAVGRTLTYGIRVHVIARDTTEEAWAVADSLRTRMDPNLIDFVQSRPLAADSEGQPPTLSSCV